MRVGNDLDGCNVDFMESCNRGLVLEGFNFRFRPSIWEFYKEHGWSGADFVAFCNRQADAGVLFDTPPLPGAVEAFNRMKKLGHTMVIITDRTFGSNPAVSQDITKMWLDKHGYQYDELHFSADKLTVATDTFVEDKLENYDALVLGGVDAYLIDQPWNRVPGGDARKRIKDVSEYADIVERITEQGFADLTFA